jgi:hypothetical protein
VKVATDDSPRLQHVGERTQGRGTGSTGVGQLGRRARPIPIQVVIALAGFMFA